MKNRQLFLHAFILLAIIGLMNFVGRSLYLYWTVWWFDALLHFLSGICVAIGGISTWFIFYNKNETALIKILWTGLFWVLFIGILWEKYELYAGLTFLSDGFVYLRDTSSDLLMDVAGGVIGVIYAHKFLSRK